MYESKDLVELGRRVAEDGIHRHERAVLEVAFRVQTPSPGVAAALADQAAPPVLRERALSVALDVLLRGGHEPMSVPVAEQDRAPAGEERGADGGVDAVGAELQHMLLDRRREPAGWGA